MLDGLEVLHNAGLILKDIKLGNLLASYDNRIVLIDDLETIAGIEETRTGQRPTEGSDRYAPPEVMQDIKNASIQSDLYSAAVCLLYMQTRKPTLIQEINTIRNKEEYEQKLDETLKENRLDEDITEFYKTALAYKPLDRYQSVDVMKANFIRYSEMEHFI